MGGNAGGNHQQPVKLHGLQGILRRPDMTDVGRVEGSAVNANALHTIPPFDWLYAYRANTAKL